MVYKYNADRNGLSEVKLLKLEPWRLYPRGEAMSLDYFKQSRPTRPRITRTTPIASIGSCFAREIKLWLVRNDYHYLQVADGPCTRSGSARYDRVYNTFTLVQEFERAFGTFAPEVTHWDFFEDGRRRLLDPYRKDVAWEDDEDMNRELTEHEAQVRDAFTSCEVLIVTIGQAEIWYRKSDGAVYPLVPPAQVFDPDRDGFRRSTVQENTKNLQRVHDLFKKHNPSATMIISLSPVPLRATFRHENAVIANASSKALLRAAIDEFLQANDDVVYFPAYEIVTTLDRDPFEDDNRHVKPGTVDRIMHLFEDWFVLDSAPAAPATTLETGQA